jgi:ParB/RepB/Spo0J family partition protein
MTFLRKTQIVKIPLADIEPNPFQPRKKFCDEEIVELAESIHNNGLIQKITVIPKVDDNLQIIESRYLLVSGERRLRAYKYLYETTTEFRYAVIEAVVDNFEIVNLQTYQERLMLNGLAENINRTDLTIIEKAQSILKIREATGRTFAQIGEALGKSESTLKNYVSLHNALTEEQRLHAIKQGLGRVELERLATKNRQVQESPTRGTVAKQGRVKPKTALQIYYPLQDLQQATKRELQGFIAENQLALSAKNVQRVDQLMRHELAIHEPAVVFLLVKKYIEEKLGQDS